MSGVDGRVAGAPITWGVCEVPGWGHQLSPKQVLTEMSAIGLRATELGPDGYMPADPRQLRALLNEHGLRPVGGFVPVVLHDEARIAGELASVVAAADHLAAAGADVLVVAAATGKPDYEPPAELAAEEWAMLVRSLDRVVEVASERGLIVALHPHYGTVVERPDHVGRILGASSVPLCIDTGHLVLGGADPLEIIPRAEARIAHVHLKDIAADLAAAVRSRRVGYHTAVRRGLYRPLGSGDVAVAEIVRSLEGAGYGGWYVLEQDTVLDAAPTNGAGPAVHAAASLEFLRGLFTKTNVAESGEVQVRAARRRHGKEEG